MAMKFSYTLSPDEAKSMKELQSFIDKVADKKINLALDFTGGKSGNGYEKVLTQLEKQIISSKDKLNSILNETFEKIGKTSFKDMFPIDELADQINNLDKTARSLKQLEKQSTSIEQGIGRWNTVLEQTTVLAEEVAKSTGEASEKVDNKQIEDLAKSYQQIIDKKVRAIVDSKQFAKATEEEQLAFAQLASGMEVAGKSADALEKEFKEMFETLGNQEQIPETVRKATERQVQLVQDRLNNALNNLTLKADQMGLQGLLPVDDIIQRINQLGQSGESLRKVNFLASEIRTELQMWGQALNNDSRELSQITELAGKLASRVDEQKELAKTNQALQEHIESRQKKINKTIEDIRLTKEFNNLSAQQQLAFNKLADSMEIVAYSVDGANTQFENFKHQLQDQKDLMIAKQVDSVSDAYEKLGGTIKNLVVRYASLQLVLHQMKQYFQEAIQYTYDIDDAYTDVAVSMDITREQFNKWTEDAQAIARANGVATSSIMDMVKIYASAGEDINDISDKLAGTAAIQNITQFDTETTTSIVNSIITQFKLMDKEINGTTGNISNAINYLGDNLIAISNELSIDNIKGIQEMANAIDDAGSVIHASGGTMEWYMGVTGALAEATNSTGKCNPPCL